MSEVILYFPDYSRKNNDSAVVGKALEECFPNDMVRVIDIHSDDPDKAAEDFRNIYGYYPTMVIADGLGCFYGSRFIGVDCILVNPIIYYEDDAIKSMHLSKEVIEKFDFDFDYNLYVDTGSDIDFTILGDDEEPESIHLAVINMEDYNNKYGLVLEYYPHVLMLGETKMTENFVKNVIAPQVKSIRRDRYYDLQRVHYHKMGNEIVDTDKTDMAKVWDYVIPDFVESIRPWAFQGTRLRKITFGRNVSSLGKGCFRDCRDLEEVDMHKCTSLKVIPMECFKACTSLKSIKLPRSVESLETDCFANTGIENVEYSNSTLRIASDAFFGFNNISFNYIPE